MSKVLEYGNKLSKKRFIIKEVLKTKIENDSYEIGKNGSGFRFVFPINNDNKFLGAISITFDEQAITSSIMKQYNVLSNIIINSKNFDKEILKNSSKYKKAHIIGFLHNINVLKDIQNKIDNKLLKIIPKHETTVKLYEQGQEKKAKSLFVEETNMIVTTIPLIHKITNENEAFISVISKGDSIGILNSNYFTIFALFVFLYFAIFLLFLQQKIRILLDQKRVQEMLKKDKQLLEQAKMAQMGEMLGNIAHQWRQPLSAISTIASGLKLNYEYKLLKEEDIPKQMDLIVDNTNYLSKTIDTFRDFIKDEKEVKDLLIQDLINVSLKIVNASIKAHHIKVIKKIDYEKAIYIKMIAGEFTQAIINILNNAKDAIVQNNIQNGWIKITQETKENNLILTIEDNAKGIKEEHLSKIFDPYFTTKHQFQGTGLGLYMSKTIIEKHLNGKIEVTNTKNGALFTITLNINQQA